MSAYFQTILKWPEAIVSLGLILTPVIAVAYTLGDDYQLAACTFGAWTVLMSSCLAGHAPRTDGILADLLLVLLVGVRTLEALGTTSNTTYDLVWAAPLACALLHACFLHLMQGDSEPSLPRKGQRALGLAAMAVVVGFGVMRYLLVDVRPGSTQMGLEMVETMLGMVLVRQLAVDGDSRDQTYQTFLVLTAIPVLQLSEWWLRLPTVALLGLVMVVAEHQRGHLLPVETFKRVAGGVGALLSSTLLWQLLVLWSAATLVVAASQTWFTTSVTFPQVIRDDANVGLVLIDDVIQPLYVATGDPGFQTTILIATPEIAQVRVGIYKIIQRSYVKLYQAVHGRSSSFEPSQDALGVIGLLPPVIIAVFTLLQVLPEGVVYVRSKWFWAFGFVGGVLSTLICHLLVTDPYVSCWVFVFSDASLTRTYTQWGWYALGANCVFAAACLAMFLVLSEEEHWRWVKPGTGARFSLEPVRRVIDTLTQPWVVCILLATALVVITVLAGIPSGFDSISPVHSAKPVPFPTGQPVWLVSTDLDKLSAASTSLVEMLDPEARIALEGAALVQYALDKLGCWGCICLNIPSLSQIESGLEDAGHFFTSAGGLLGRRRLLEHQVDTTHTGRRALVRVSSSPGRRLLSSSCSHDSCSMTQICVSDVVSDVVEQLTSIATDGLAFVGNEIAQAIIALIPLASTIDGWLSRVPELDPFANYELLALPSVNFRFQAGFINLAWAHLPSTPSAPTLGWQLAVVAVCLVVAVWSTYQLGVLMPVLRATYAASVASVAAVLAGVVAAAVVVVFQMRGQLRAEGWDLQIVWNSSVSIVYAVALALVVIAVFLAAGATPPPPPHSKQVKPELEMQPLLLSPDGKLPKS